VALPAEGTRCDQDWPDFTAPEPAAKTLRAAAAKRLVIAPQTRPLLLP